MAVIYLSSVHLTNKSLPIMYALKFVCLRTYICKKEGASYLHKKKGKPGGHSFGDGGFF